MAKGKSSKGKTVELPTDLAVALLTSPGGAAVVQGVTETIAAAIELGNVIAIESTKREEIRARRDILIEKIRQERDVMLQYLADRAAAQADTLNQLFSRLDTALEAGDAALISPILNSIVDTVKASPLGDLATFQQRLEDDSFVLKLGRPGSKSPD